MGHTGAGCSPQVQHFASRLDVNVVHTSQHRGCQLGPEGVPHPVLCLLALARLNTDPLLIVHTASNRRTLLRKRLSLTPGEQDGSGGQQAAEA